MAGTGMGDAAEVRKKLSHNFERINACYHESGHAISGLLNFIMIYSISVAAKHDRRTWDNLGTVHYEVLLDVEFIKENEQPVLFRRLLENEIQINYAGLAAEKIFYKEIVGTYHLPMIIKFGSYFDRDNAAELVKKYNLAPAGKKRHLLKKELYNRTQQELEQHWGDVKLLAHGLYKKNKLTFSDIKDILGKKSEYKEFWKKRLKEIETCFKRAKTAPDVVADIILSR
jgi:hypothetical protein